MYARLDSSRLMLNSNCWGGQHLSFKILFQALLVFVYRDIYFVAVICEKLTYQRHNGGGSPYIATIGISCVNIGCAIAVRLLLKQISNHNV